MCRASSPFCCVCVLVPQVINDAYGVQLYSPKIQHCIVFRDRIMRIYEVRDVVTCAVVNLVAAACSCVATHD